MIATPRKTPEKEVLNEDLTELILLRRRRPQRRPKYCGIGSDPLIVTELTPTNLIN